jgi:POT family proton-dependent oligopeptide transporter
MATANVVRQRTFLGHPVGLYVLFFTEMWERFSYYGMRALLMLYMTKYFKWVQADASAVYKWYTSLVYLTPILGGFLADRYLGNRLAVIIGAALMAVGHFLMAFEEYPVFFSALIFLIIGNGFFKPNMSTQVGRLYPKNDPRRDGAYTIFYMGINLGAFLSPLICGWLQQNTVGGYHSGFTMAGIGMVIGLLTYLLGQPFIREIDNIVPPAPERLGKAERAISEQEAANTPSTFCTLNGFAPALLYGLAGLAAIVAVWTFIRLIPGFKSKEASAILVVVSNAVMPWVITAGVFVLLGWVVGQLRNAVRDRVMSILLLGIFVVCFWAAFEQAGNVLNLWAEDSTNRYLSRAPDAVSVYPDPVTFPDTSDPQKFGVFERFRVMFNLKPSRPAAEKAGDSGESWLVRTFNPVPTTWFQSINAVMIVLLAPVMAWVWIRVRISIPLKMACGLFFMALSVAVMIEAGRRENRPAELKADLGALPEGVAVNGQGLLCEETRRDDGTVDAEAVEAGKLEPFHAGRLNYDASQKTFHVTGALARTEFERIVRSTASANFRRKVADLRKRLDQQWQENKPLDAGVVLDDVPAGFDMRYTGLQDKDVSFDPATKTLSARVQLADKDEKSLLFGAGDPKLRDTVGRLFVETAQFQVSSWWLVWSYLFATIGELCLSPVGLSMVSKLAPARFATMLMGLWLLTSFFGNYLAGAFGESYGEVAPIAYFSMLTAALAVAWLVLLLLVRKAAAMMHGVE